MKDDKYQKMATHYDKIKSIQEDKMKFIESFLPNMVTSTLLDCSCGTGFEIDVLHNRGYNVSGSDISESMLEIARKKFTNTLVKIANVDFHILHEHYPQKFDVVLCLSNSINEIHVNPIKALNSMASVLQPGGVIIFDQGQTDYSMKNPPTRTQIIDNDNFCREMLMSYKNNIMSVEVIDTIINGENTIQSSKLDLIIRLKSDWIKIENETDFKFSFFGSWDFTEYDIDSSNRLIIVVKKA